VSTNANLTNGAAAAFLALSLAASPVSGDEAEAPLDDGRKWETWTELGGYASNRSYARRGELALWAPFSQDADSLFFLDLRGKLVAEDQQEGNAALGYRFMTSSGWNPGIWIASTGATASSAPISIRSPSASKPCRPIGICASTAMRR